MSLTNVGERMIANVFFSGENPPSVLYVGLATDAVDDSTTLATVSEPTVGGYSRQQIVFGEATTDAEGNTVVANSSQVTFGPFEDGFTAKYAFVTDAQSGTEGNLILYLQLTKQRTADAGDSMFFAPSKLRFTID